MNKVVIKRTTSENTDFRYLISLLDQNLIEINGDIQRDYDEHNIINYIETVVVAYVDGEPAGCGCFKKFAFDMVEIKRMYTNPQYRGQGIASAILTELEIWASLLGNDYAVLETGIRHSDAISLYHKLGYIDIEKYGAYVNMPESVCMRKQLK